MAPIVADEVEVIVQHDWFQSISTPPHKFFVGMRQSETKTTFFDAIVSPKDGSIEVERTDRIAAHVKGRSLQVFLNTGESTYFVAPLIEFGVIHKASIQTVDVTPSGSMMLTSDANGILRVSSTTDGRLLRELEGHSLHLSSAKVFPSGLVVLAGGGDLQLRVWSIETAEIARTLKGHRMAITDAQIIGIGKDVISCSRDGTGKRWNCGRGECDITWSPDAGECNSIALSPDAMKVAIACSLNKIAIYPIDGDVMLTSISVPGSPSSLAFSPCGSRLACGDENGAVYVFDPHSGQLILHLRTKRGRVEKVAWRPEGIFVAYHNGTIAVYDADDFKPYPKFELSGGDCDPIYDFCFHNDERMLAQTLLRVRFPIAQAIRGKRNKFKPKIAKTRPERTPSVCALDHFDFYYKPFFGKSSWESNVALLQEEGTFDLLKKVQDGTADKNTTKKMKKMNELAKEETQKIFAEMDGGASTSNLLKTAEELDMMRTEAGMGEFNPTRGELSQGERHFGNTKLKKEQKELQITGYEGEGIRLPSRPHFISYPKNLRIQVMQRCDISRYPPPMRDESQVPGWWLLDGGSVVPILAMGFEEGDTFMDMCAAPGGKSLLALLTKLPKKIICNDYKLARLGDLKRSLSIYVPAECPDAEKIILKRKDASNLAQWDEFNVYDKVLADVPCLSDRLSVGQDEGNLFELQHTQKRLDLPQLQTKILINALRSARVGGSVVYSTCTLSPSQNEAVIENAVAIAEQQFGIKVVEESLSLLKNHLAATGLYRFNDETQRGILVLPFLPSNFGPMYVCKLHRLK
ncbi:unnamed protein product, partial [Mesorhabditis belari]|uniref:NOL1/NOP2/Sun domain family member 4 n=1 Tax=Mesorhabditis belari TaxID=2138241 RepID=A0AAF3F1J5_9BILA